MAKASRRHLWAQKILGKNTNAASTQASVVSALKKPYTGIILGIDPSLRGTGLALLSIYKSKQVVLHESMTLRFSSSQSFAECLGGIAKEVKRILGIMPVNHVAIEQTIYVQNFQTAQVLGAARGAAISAVAVENIPVFEYPPLRVKQAVVGYGRASKDQVSRTVMNYLPDAGLLAFDEADAVAVALCHAFTWKGENN